MPSERHCRDRTKSTALKATSGGKDSLWHHVTKAFLQIAARVREIPQANRLLLIHFLKLIGFEITEKPGPGGLSKGDHNAVGMKGSFLRPQGNMNATKNNAYALGAKSVRDRISSRRRSCDTAYADKIETPVKGDDVNTFINQGDVRVEFLWHKRRQSG